MGTGTLVVKKREGNSELGRDSYVEIPTSVLQGPPGSGRLTRVHYLQKRIFQ